MLHEIFFGKYYLRLKKGDKKFNFRFAAMPKTILTSPQDPAWTLSAVSVQSSGSSDEEESFITPRDAEILHVYNTAMSRLA